MSNNIIQLNTSKPVQLEQSSSNSHFQPTKLPGLWNTVVTTSEEDINQLSEILEDRINSSPGDLQLRIDLVANIKQSKDIDNFKNTSIKLLDIVFDEVIMGYMLDLHDGIPDGLKLTVRKQIIKYLCLIKIKCSSNTEEDVTHFDIGLFLDVNSLGVLVTITSDVIDKFNSNVYPYTPDVL